MTKQKSFKGRVRARMDKTSESYTTARRQLLAKSTADTEAAAPAVPADQATPPVPGTTLPYSDKAIRANTGRGWDEWFEVLDRWGAVERTHTEIARWVNQEHGVGGWWSQGVTVGYERARGLRALGQRRGGLFEVNASRTVAVPVERLYEAFADPALRERWLPGETFEVRVAHPGRSIRANWDDGSTLLVVGFTARGESKSQVSLVHQRIPDAETAAKLKPWWRDRVAALKQLLEA
jgi:hypothetical protein